MNFGTLLGVVLLCSMSSTTGDAYEGDADAAGRSCYPVSPSNSFYLTDSDLKILKIQARKGDVDAMLRVADYYGIYLSDTHKSHYWLERAADAGHQPSRNFLLGHYAEQESLANVQYGQRLALRWRKSQKKYRSLADHW